jgi:hypothetical protein
MKTAFRPTLTQLEGRALLSSWHGDTLGPLASKPAKGTTPVLKGAFSGTYDFLRGTMFSASYLLAFNGSGTLGKSKAWEGGSIQPGPIPFGSPISKALDFTLLTLKANKNVGLALLVLGAATMARKGSHKIINATLRAYYATGSFIHDIGTTVSLSLNLKPGMPGPVAGGLAGKFIATITPV